MNELKIQIEDIEGLLKQGREVKEILEDAIKSCMLENLIDELPSIQASLEVTNLDIEAREALLALFKKRFNGEEVDQADVIIALSKRTNHLNANINLINQKGM